ncbi:NEW3 domain-containing protein [Ferviditalea candida]|uniref:NEW3 domain-containing protein n=1 Tax=Ferviditalea candida TaxID=3108399 RepID=A0ABU5ZIT1_9BACL|nr:NEW3 domain-containing protein [Paenibacillaceae bacterium T2]
MRLRRMLFGLLLTFGLVAGNLLGGAQIYAAGGISLYTPFTDISVTPGQTVTFSIDVINNSASIQDVPLNVEGIPGNWTNHLTYGSYAVHKIAVKPNDSKSVDLDVEVPLAVNKGDYPFRVTAGDYALQLNVNVSEQGTYNSELNVNQPNMQGHSDSTFSFTSSLKNRTADKQDYALSADAPKGWDVQFSSLGKNVTSVSVDKNSAQDISIDIHPPAQVKAGTYDIPIHAATTSSSADTKLEVVITGTYGIELTTPSGVLSTDITAGGTRNVDLKVVNKGSADLKNIQLSASTPANWEVTFDQKELKALSAGKSANVTATIKADSKAIAGDYQLNFTASTPETSSDAQFRITVQTSMLWGWIGILIIGMVFVGIYYLFRTYGRR